jgi:general secretion pathway protein G
MIVILASLGLAQYQNSVTRTKEAVLKENLFRMRDAIDQYYADKGRYPVTLESLASEGYLRQIPIDPFTGTAESWQQIPAEPDLSNPFAEMGVFDVKSGSEATALDGTPYWEW